MNWNRVSSCFAALVMLGSPALCDVATAQTADLEVTKVLVAAPEAGPGIAPGANVLYSVSIRNIGPNTATNVIVGDPTPEKLTLVSNTGACTTSYPCTIASIPASTTVNIQSTYSVPANYAPPTAIYNYAIIDSASQSDPNSDNNYQVAVTPINGINCGNLNVAAGQSHACSIVSGNGSGSLPDDLAECWGSDVSGEALPVGGTFSSITAGALHSCGIHASTGAIECWGNDDDGQVSGTPSSGVFLQIDAGLYYTCAVRSDKAVLCWGFDGFGETAAPPSLFAEVSAGQSHTCGRTVAGRIECWGDDSEGQVSNSPSGDGFTQVVSGGFHSCALHTDKSVTCWGSDYSGEAQNQAGPFDFISAGAEHNCGVKPDESVQCWGYDGFGDPNYIPPAESFSTLDCGGYFTCGVLFDGTILCWGEEGSYQVTTPPSRSLQCPVCGDGVEEGAEECENDGAGGPFPPCCSPVSCRPYRLSEAHICGPATGPCDVPEVCKGAADVSICPTNIVPFRPNGYICRQSDGGCDDPEVCNGTNDICPPNEPFRDSSFTCRAVAGSCDIEEKCPGGQAACPTDQFKAGGTSCRGIAGICDLEEFCTGSAAACPADIGKDSETECRASAGICDVAEFCNGQPTCPNDAFQDGNVVCRGAVTACDFPETCSGFDATCPPDILQPNTFVCRAASDSCDAAEKCDGTSNLCPPDLIATAGTICRLAVGICDVTETCTGSVKSCPADVVASSAVTCRAAVDGCDVAEKCTGSTNSCPANAFASTETACNDGLFCNGADNCNGSGACNTHAGDPCPGDDGDANCSETCNEAADSCSTNDPDGSSCSDADACTTGEVCTNGFCGGGTVEDCDDGNLCTFDTCDLTEGCVHLAGIEDTGCLTAGRGLLIVRDSPAAPDKKLIKWGWKQGETIPSELLGSPEGATDYALCLYDQSGGETSLVGSYVIPGGTGGWKVKPGKNKFGNKDAPPDGIYSAKNKASSLEGKSSSGIKGAGTVLGLPTPAGSQIFFLHEPSMVVQLRNDEGMCLTTEFFGEDFKKNSGDKVKAVFKK